ncbi:hypothetical protein EST38_g12133, partial [Candolleomyces aberdarensis]
AARQAPGSIPAEVAVKSDGNTISVYRREEDLAARQAPGSIPAEVAVKSDGNTISVY